MYNQIEEENLEATYDKIMLDKIENEHWIGKKPQRNA